MASVVTKCKNCRQTFVKNLHRCPGCGARSPMGKYAIAAKMGSIVATVVALTVAFVLVRKIPVEPETHQSTSLLPAPRGDEEISLQ
jgi:hypothetical protein